MKSRLNIAPKYTSLIENIDNTDFLTLSSTNTPRIKLLSYAMAIGIKNNTRSIDSSSVSVVRNDSIDSSCDSLMKAIYLGAEGIEKHLVDNLNNYDEIYRIVEGYINAGMQSLSDIYHENAFKDDEEYLWNELADLDKKYDEFFGESENRK